MIGVLDQVDQAVGVLIHLIKFLGHAVAVEIQSGGHFLVRLGQLDHPLASHRPVGCGGEDPLSVGPGLKR